MKYEHPETGLQVMVDQITETFKTTDSGGTVYITTVNKYLVTDCGQKAFADGDDLNAVNVICRGEPVRLVRVEK